MPGPRFRSLSSLQLARANETLLIESSDTNTLTNLLFYLLMNIFMNPSLGASNDKWIIEGMIRCIALKIARRTSYDSPT
jgi:hypothetical protein